MYTSLPLRRADFLFFVVSSSLRAAASSLFSFSSIANMSGEAAYFAGNEHMVLFGGFLHHARTSLPFGDGLTMSVGAFNSFGFSTFDVGNSARRSAAGVSSSSEASSSEASPTTVASESGFSVESSFSTTEATETSESPDASSESVLKDTVTVSSGIASGGDDPTSDPISDSNLDVSGVRPCLMGTSSKRFISYL